MYVGQSDLVFVEINLIPSHFFEIGFKLNKVSENKSSVLYSTGGPIGGLVKTFTTQKHWCNTFKAALLLEYLKNKL